ncbi:MAG: hypothetical protein KIH08_01615 [Candidatus Freyarchaeota archaeon]|nr:hypothetical protein [Candidatus Jordarchaeia archaeon]MBS7268815.1 hypothetical protein [Candidatus Jordarchaeia archaeon]MBS7279148.1 hypothetical protein [Candidatus Jordarchaeia archaeon]
METKKLAALTVLTLFTLLLITPLATNTTATNTLPPLTLSNQANVQKITTEPLGAYVQNGSNITYDVLLAFASIFPGGELESEGFQFAFEFYYNSSAWGDWFIVFVAGPGYSPGYFAIHNQTREIGLNSTGGLFPTPPANESEIVRQSNVYAFIALPTGIKAGDNIQIMAPYWIEAIVPEVVVSEVMGRVTTPTFNQTGGPSSFYDSWMTQGIWRGTITLGVDTFQCAMGLNNFAEKTSGLSVASIIAESLIFEEGLYSFHVNMQFNSTASTPNIIESLTNANITGYSTTESSWSGYQANFTYSEAGYWYMDVTEPTNGSLGVVTLNSLGRSYFNWTMGIMNASGFITGEIGISQEVQIPNDLWQWRWNSSQPWNPTYYNETTKRGWRDIYLNGTDTKSGILNLLRFFYDASSIFPVGLLGLAPPYIREGTVMTLLVWLPLFFPNNTMPLFNFGDYQKPDYVIMFLAPFKVSGATTVNIGGYSYDCWKADMILPLGLSNYNITQLSYTAYFGRNSGILLEAKADMEMKIPAGDVLLPFGYHKTWTLSDVSGSGLEPLKELEGVGGNRYTLEDVVEKTLDSSFLNGGSVTIKSNDTLHHLEMYTYTRHQNYTSINGYPIVKLMNIYVHDGLPLELNATLNFYYTPSELSVRGAKASDFTICYYNKTSESWVPLNTTVDSNGRIVSANITYLEYGYHDFALVAAQLTIWDILGPGGIMFLWYLLLQSSAPMGGMMLPILGGIAALLVVIIVAAAVILARRHKIKKG